MKRKMIVITCILLLATVILFLSACELLATLNVTTEPTVTSDEELYSEWVSNGDGTHSRYLLSDPDRTETEDCKWEKEVVAATCVSGGYTEKRCTLCKASVTTNRTEINPDAHALEHHDGQVPTCVTTGWASYDTCTLCDYTTYAEIPKADHEFSVWTYVDALVHGRSCLHCDFAEEEIHSVVLDKAVEATCSAEGCTEGTHCSVCEKVLSGHSVIEKDPDNHSLEIVAAKIASCLEDGWKEYKKCRDCTYSEQQIIPALGHTFESEIRSDEEKHYYSCIRCGEKIQEAHVVEVDRSEERSCFRDGLTEGAHCSVCQRVLIPQEVIPQYGEHSIITHERVLPTCETAGHYAYATCARCDYSNIKEIPALGHDKVYHEGKSATCTEDGYEEYYTCSRCTYNTFVAIPQTGHALLEEEGKEATCTEVGYEAYIYCLKCDYTTREDIPALGHEKVQHDAVDATCILSGNYAYETCLRCDYSTFESIPPLGHTQGERGFDETGHYYFCLNCDEHLSFEEHTPVADKMVEATCVTTGKTEGAHCSECGYVITAQTTIPTNDNHDLIFYEGQAPTCTKDGFESYQKCSRCEYSTFVSIDATGHTLEHLEAKAPTCVETGYNAYEYCLFCEYTTCEVISALGHDEVYHESVAATCTEAGHRSYTTCTRCDYSTAYIEIEPLGHRIFSYARKEATCTESGYEAYKKCNRCDYTTYIEILPLGHTKGDSLSSDAEGHFYTCIRCPAEMDRAEHDPVVDPAQEPNCYIPGKTEGSHCSICNYVITAQAVIPTNQAHDLVEHVGKAPTCTESGYDDYVTCSKCSYSTYKYRSALGHSSGSYQKNKTEHWTICTRCSVEISRAEHSFFVLSQEEGDCVTQGTITYQCSMCFYNYQESSGQLGHDYVITIVPKTCYSYAQEVHTCSRCSDSYVVTTDKTYAPHTYEANTCIYCQRDEMLEYSATFAAHGNSSSDKINITSMKQLGLLFDYIYFNMINEYKYFTYQGMTVSAVSDLIEAGKHAMTGQNWPLDWGYQRNGETITYIKARYYNYGSYSSENVCTVTPDSGEYEVAEYYQLDFMATSRSFAKRADDYSAFPYLSRRNSVSVTTSDQLFYAFSHGYLPVPTAGSAAARILNKAKDICREVISDQMNDSEKLYAITKWAVMNVTYDHGAVYADDNEEEFTWQYCTAWYAEGVFDYGLAVCDGISKAVCILAGIEDIKCIRVVNKNHAWNKVWIDLGSGEKAWYVIDVTHINSTLSPNYEVLSMKNFLISDSQKSELGYEYLNYSESPCVADTNTNPYSLIHFGKGASTSSNDYVIEFTSELNSIISYYVAGKAASSTDRFTLEIFVKRSYCYSTGDVDTAVWNALHANGYYASFTRSITTVTYGSTNGYRVVLYL